MIAEKLRSVLSHNLSTLGIIYRFFEIEKSDDELQSLSFSKGNH